MARSESSYFDCGHDEGSRRIEHLRWHQTHEYVRQEVCTSCWTIIEVMRVPKEVAEMARLSR